MRYMGIDYGKKRIGVALSDESGAIAFPEVVLLASDTAPHDIASLVKERSVGAIVLGESLTYMNEPNTVMPAIERFKDSLAQLVDVPLVYQPEQMSSVAAGRFQGKHEKSDASAAAIILQWYLDRTDRTI